MNVCFSVTMLYVPETWQREEALHKSGHCLDVKTVQECSHAHKNLIKRPPPFKKGY